MRGQAPLGTERLRIRARIAIREHQHVRPSPCVVAHTVGGEVAKPSWHPSECDNREPPDERADGERPADRHEVRRLGVSGLSSAGARGAEPPADDGRQRESRDCEQQAQRDLPASLRLRPGNLDVHRIAGVPGEAREWVRDEAEITVQVCGVADVGREEIVQTLWRTASHERRYPRRNRREDDGDRPQHEPDEVRDREQQAEEDGEARAAKVVVDGEPDRMVVHGPESTMLRCR